MEPISNPAANDCDVALPASLCSLLCLWRVGRLVARVAEPAQSPQRRGAKRSLSKDPPGMKRLMAGYDVWIDPVNKRVVLDGTVCLREGQLEMFACTKGTKEHESILAVDTKAYAVHAGLLAVGAEVGTPVQFQPTYKPATGTEIDINLIWTDKNGRSIAIGPRIGSATCKPASRWNIPGSSPAAVFGRTRPAARKATWPSRAISFASRTFPAPCSICPSKAARPTTSCCYEAYTEHIPPLGTRVRMVLTPKLKK